MHIKKESNPRCSFSSLSVLLSTMCNYVASLTLVKSEIRYWKCYPLFLINCCFIVSSELAILFMYFMWLGWGLYCKLLFAVPSFLFILFLVYFSSNLGNSLDFFCYIIFAAMFTLFSRLKTFILSWILSASICFGFSMYLIFQMIITFGNSCHLCLDLLLLLHICFQ